MEEDEFHRQRLQQHGLLAVVSKLCIGPERLPVRHAEKGEIHNVSDSGWILRSGTETDEYDDDSSNYVIVPFDRMVATDESLELLYDQPEGTELTRRSSTEPWRWIVDGKVVDEDGRVIATLS